MKPLNLTIDIAAGSSLFLALILVYVLDRSGSSDEPIKNDLEVRVLGSGGSEPMKKLRLAVTPTHAEFDKIANQMVLWDDMGKLLRELGEGYANFKEVLPIDLLNNPRLIDDFDVLFLTCAPGGQELRNTLVRFVTNGGTLYASDWRFEAVADAFPEVVAKDLIGKGNKGEVIADVVDPGLQDVLKNERSDGKKIHLRFDLPLWKTAAFAGPRVKTLIKGQYKKIRDRFDVAGQEAVAPLMVQFPVGKGNVVFTSFHNERLNRDVEKKLLQYLVFRLVTARVDSEVNDTISEGGFEPQKSNLLSTPKEQPSVTRTYTAKKKGPLRFALGFPFAGPKLRFKIKSPDGKTYTWEGTSTVVLEVPEAQPGDWEYTITAMTGPHENFPFTVTVGEKR